MAAHQFLFAVAPASEPPRDIFPAHHWGIYRQVIEEIRDARISFALGGALAVAGYTGGWRYTKDMDLYVLPESREAMIAILSRAGLHDYYDTLAYDRGWIYRGNVDDVIVDVIWGMPNRRAQVDAEWFSRCPEMNIHGERVPILSPEELIWAKIYVLQRDRSDWPDILNLIHATGPELDWERLLTRLGEEGPLLAAILSVFGWLSPARARQLPGWLWTRLGMTPPEERPSPEVMKHRASLLDTRPWFRPTIEE
jgi:putative nucleotidyltransferase-like protein